MVVAGLHRERRMLCFPHTQKAECDLPWVFLQINKSNRARISLFADLVSTPGSQIQNLKVPHQNVKQNYSGTPSETHREINWVELPIFSGIILNVKRKKNE